MDLKGGRWAQSSLAFKSMASEGGVLCYRAVVEPVSVEYKIVIILAESLKFLPQVDLGLRYIEKYSFPIFFVING